MPQADLRTALRRAAARGQRTALRRAAMRRACRCRAGTDRGAAGSRTGSGSAAGAARIDPGIRHTGSAGARRAIARRAR
jgi:hypothetical protein